MRFAAAIVWVENAELALNDGSSVIDPSDLVHAVEIAQITVPEVLAPEA